MDGASFSHENNTVARCHILLHKNTRDLRGRWLAEADRIYIRYDMFSYRNAHVSLTLHCVQQSSLFLCNLDIIETTHRAQFFIHVHVLTGIFQGIGPGLSLSHPSIHPSFFARLLFWRSTVDRQGGFDDRQSIDSRSSWRPGDCRLKRIINY